MCPGVFLEDRIREIFLKAFLSLFKNYRSFLKVSNDGLVIKDRWNFSIGEYFSFGSFVSAADRENRVSTEERTGLILTRPLAFFGNVPQNPGVLQLCL